jgi:hypothetical protein
MKNCLQIALEVKTYIEREGRTLAVSQGKMLKDSISNYESNFDKQTA